LIEGTALVRFAGAERRDVVDTFTEVQTGKGADALERRPQLAAALKVVRRLTCPVVSKLDRINRDVHFTRGSLAQRVPFIVTELKGRRGAEQTDAALAEKERRVVGERTRAGLSFGTQPSSPGRPCQRPPGAPPGRNRAMYCRCVPRMDRNRPSIRGLRQSSPLSSTEVSATASKWTNKVGAVLRQRNSRRTKPCTNDADDTGVTLSSGLSVAA
jgi:Resolvase, N terminal domain